MYKYKFYMHMISGNVETYSAQFDEKQDPDTLANDIVRCKFTHVVSNGRLTIINMANVESMVVTGPFCEG